MSQPHSAKPATILSGEPASEVDQLGGKVNFHNKTNTPEVQGTALVTAPSGKVVVGFPVAKEISEAEKARRVMVEATRLANLTPGEWRLWIDASAERLGIPRDSLQAAVLDIIKDQDKRKRAAEAEARRIEQRAEKQRAVAKREEEREQRQIEKDAERKDKEKSKAFAAIVKLPAAQHEAKLAELAKLLDQDLEVIREEFTDFVAADAHADSGYVEPWPEPVKTEELLAELMAQLRRYVVTHDEGTLAITLWVMMAWLHAEIATHSPILVLTSAEENSGKTTCASVLGFLTPRAYSAVEMTGAGLFHIVDQWHPTLIVDEADKLFPRKTDLMHIVNAGWTRGVKIPRLVHGVMREFDVFCPKLISMKGLDLPSTTASRAIVIELLPKLPDERVEDFKFADDDTFLALRRKLTRWATDNAAVLKDSQPTMPPGFVNRLAQNWRLLLAISDLTADALYKQAARAAAVKLSRKTVKRSEGVRLLEALRQIFAECDEAPAGLLMPHLTVTEAITSAQIVQTLITDEEGEWCQFRGRSPITQRQLAALLAAYDIRPGVLHPTKRSGLSRRGYRRAQFDDAFRRYLPPDPNIRTQEQ